MNIRKQRFEPRYKIIRNEKNFSLQNYVRDFSQLPLNIIYSFDDPNDQVDTLNSLITDCLSRHVPVKRVKLTRPPAPWMQDPEIVRSKNHLEDLRKRKVNDTDEYRNVRNKHKRLVKNKKSSFIRKSLSSKNSKEVWQTIHRILKPQSSRIKHEPETLNQHYTTLASRLCNKENIAFKAEDLMEDLYTDDETKLQLRPTTYDEVNKIISNLRNDCSSGYDAIPIKYLKPVCDFITSPMVHIINNAIKTGVFPEKWKIARVCPIPKIKNPTVAKDFRPVSILPVLSKVFEKVILMQILQHIETSVYNQTQSGFRKGHSTSTILLKLRDAIKQAMNKSEITLAVMIDYSKAFDTIDHSIMVRKLRNLGFGSSVIKVIVSYLSNRKQFVQIDDKKSKTENIFFGVPQGSILGPILFNVYVSELPTIIETPSMQYADDTTLHRSCHKNQLTNSIKLLEEDLSQLSSWSTKNGLIFNDDKLQMIFFHKPRSLPADRSYLVRSNGHSVKQEISVKLLGVKIDQNLSWTDQINHVTKCAQSNLQTIKRFKRFTPFNVRKTLAESLVLSKINYCNTVFSQTPQYMRKKLQRVQTSAAGYVLRKYAHREDVVNLGWLLVDQKVEMDLAVAGYKALNDENWPSYLKMSKLILGRNLRSNEIGTMINRGENGSFQEQVALVFNDLPKSLREESSIKIFYKNTKKYFLDRSIAISLA